MCQQQGRTSVCPRSFLDQLGKEKRPVFRDGPCAFLAGSAGQSGGGGGSKGRPPPSGVQTCPLRTR